MPEFADAERVPVSTARKLLLLVALYIGCLLGGIAARTVWTLFSA